jgi:hypothetical protein
MKLDLCSGAAAAAAMELDRRRPWISGGGVEGAA